MHDSIPCPVGGVEPAYYDVKMICAVGGITCLDYVSEGLVLFGDYDGHVLKSDTGSINILELEDVGLVGSDYIYSIIYLESDICLCSDYDGNVYRSINRGVTWTFVQNLGAEATPLAYTGAGRVVAASKVGTEWKFWLSNDYGQSFNVNPLSVTTTHAVHRILYLGGDYCATVVYGRIFMSSDGGDIWSDIGAFPFGSHLYLYSGFSIGNGYAFMYASDGHIYWTPDYLTLAIYDLGYAHNIIQHDRTSLSFYFENVLEKLKEEDGKVWLRPTGIGDWTEVGVIQIGSQIFITLFGLGVYIYGGWSK